MATPYDNHLNVYFWQASLLWNSFLVHEGQLRWKRWKVLRRMKIFFLRRKRRAEETNEKILWEKEILIHREKRQMQKEKTFFLLQNLYYAHSDINNKELVSSERFSTSNAPLLSDDWYIGWKASVETVQVIRSSEVLISRYYGCKDFANPSMPQLTHWCKYWSWHPLLL